VKRILLVAVVLALVAAGGVAVAAAPGGGGEINACAYLYGGYLRAVDSPGDCRPWEEPLSWNAAGPDGGGPCYGTYLVDLGQSVGIWTLSRDGTVQVTDSAEEFIGFSHEQGAWTHTDGQNAKATFIDMTFDTNGALPAGYARADAELAFGDGCDDLTGTLDLRAYGSAGDPLDPTDGFQIGEDIPFTGRRVNP
jgi:hypothetical protein